MASVATIQSFFVVFNVIQTVYAANDFDLNLGELGENGGDDFMDSFGSLLDSLVGATGEDGDCTFRCPETGQITKPRSDYLPSSNGCGSHGIKLDTKKLPKMTKCCNKHDICYDTCNSVKDSCDRIFKKCLDEMCMELEDKLSKDEYDGCDATAQLMYHGTVALGCGSFINSQKAACECVSESSQTTPSKQAEKSQIFRKDGEL
ncbi:group XIIA secretory phospholipase A2-like [Mizuhopecten yessoensis]|uniref:Group XIIB secretory phospholipase A2-like protein n=1 Tax=Mizuhopecten yessoensis TaxID=6573 RepID=A0A210PLX1_MIZYE|nr:group XIIA secretory phospholipase A2-like [Mizuhopecten yessoensis]OWF37500.1 Group XIIB secretory phospholipase A2-like protein [Mizuhopecten yessoensis]